MCVSYPRKKIIGGLYIKDNMYGPKKKLKFFEKIKDVALMRIYYNSAFAAVTDVSPGVL